MSAVLCCVLPPRGEQTSACRADLERTLRAESPPHTRDLPGSRKHGVIRAIVFDDSPYLLRGLFAPNPRPIPAIYRAGKPACSTRNATSGVPNSATKSKHTQSYLIGPCHPGVNSASESPDPALTPPRPPQPEPPSSPLPTSYSLTPRHLPLYCPSKLHRRRRT